MAAPLIRYGLKWPTGTSELEVERQMIRRGGRWTSTTGKEFGEGMFIHYQRFESLLWPELKLWHRWNELQLAQYLEHRTIGIIGPASSGKTNGAATDALTDYYVWPECTSVIICSTTKERLEDRIWGEIKKYHKAAKKLWPELPGNLIEGRLRLVTDHRNDSEDGRDFRNGIIGVACKSGGNYVGLGDFIGLKNKRVRLIADELQLLPSAFVFAISNLDKNPDFKAVGLGNPKETTDALGALCEPAFELGGWEGGIDQTPETKTWKTRRPDGVCLQLVGTDSPNLDGHLGIPLITQEAIDRDISQYGKDSLQFTMMNQGMMPKGQGSRRVLTRQLCHKNGAMEDPVWADGGQINIGFLDAAYKGVGGDRCVFGQLKLGWELVDDPDASTTLWNVANQNTTNLKRRQIIELVDEINVPVNVKIDVEAEEQIVNFVREQCGRRGIPPENLFYDSGMRTALVTAFGRIWSPQVNAIDCGGAPSDRPVNSSMTITPAGQKERPKRCDEHYSKFITELWFSVRLAIESGQFRGMTESCMKEGCQREWRMVGKNRIEVETKVDMKAKTGYSPDLFDALAIGVEGARRLGLVFNGLAAKADERDTKTSAWKRELREKAQKVWAEGQLTYN